MQRRPVWIATVTIIGWIVALSATFRATAQQGAAPRALDVSVPITYYIATGSEKTGYQPSDRQLALWALSAWQQTVGAGLRLESKPEPDALVRVYWAEPNDTQYGEMRPLMVGGRRGAAVFIRPDVAALGTDIALRARGDVLFRDTIVFLTCLHELGHAFGLTHTSDFRDIMYFFGYGGNIVEFFDRYRRQLRSKVDISGVSGLSEEDVRRMRALYAR